MLFPIAHSAAVDTWGKSSGGQLPRSAVIADLGTGTRYTHVPLPEQVKAGHQAFIYDFLISLKQNKRSCRTLPTARGFLLVS